MCLFCAPVTDLLDCPMKCAPTSILSYINWRCVYFVPPSLIYQTAPRSVLPLQFYPISIEFVYSILYQLQLILLYNFKSSAHISIPLSIFHILVHIQSGVRTKTNNKKMRHLEKEITIPEIIGHKKLENFLTSYTLDLALCILP